MKRYWYTRSFNRLAGKNTAPAARRVVDRTPLYRGVFIAAALLFWGIGLFFVFFAD